MGSRKRKKTPVKPAAKSPAAEEAVHEAPLEELAFEEVVAGEATAAPAEGGSAEEPVPEERGEGSLVEELPPAEEATVEEAAVAEEKVEEEVSLPGETVEDIPVLTVIPEDAPAELSLPEARGEEEITVVKAEPLEIKVIGGSGTGVKLPERDPGATRKKGVEIGFQIGASKSKPSSPAPAAVAAEALPEDKAASWDDDEVVHRLEVPLDEDEPEYGYGTGQGVARIEPLESGPAMPVHPRHRQKKHYTIRQMTIVMAIVTVLLTILIAFLTQLRTQKRSSLDQGPVFTVETAKLDESESSQFVRNVISLNAEAEGLLRKYADAKTADEALQIVRDPERVKPRFLKLWKPWVNPHFAERQEFGSMIVEGPNNRPALGLTGERGDYSNFFALFVKENGRLRLDWEATYGVGDFLVPEMADGIGKEPAMVRVIVKPEAYFNAIFPEEEYRAYQLMDDTREEYVWGYAKIGTPVADAVSNVLNQDSYVIEQKRDAAMTLKVGRLPGAETNQFLILEVLHKGWVSP